MNTNKGYHKKDLTEPVLINFFAEYSEREKLREKALKESKTISQILRDFIKRLK